MKLSTWPAASIGAALMILLIGCNGDRRNAEPADGSSDTAAATSDTAAAAAATGASYDGDAKATPAPGTGNVQGKVLYNGKPVAGIEVKLCEKFNRFLGGCDGKSYSVRTDKDGEYLLANVEPKVYEGLAARVFETDRYVFAATGIGGLQSATYEVKAGKTLFISPTSLFKSDLKVSSPKPGSTASAKNLELTWPAYPDAAYYKLSLFPEEDSVTADYIGERVDGTSFHPGKPLPKGTYNWQLEAFNGDDQKLAESSNDIKFTVTE